jgi:hypothetical protein
VEEICSTQTWLCRTNKAGGTTMKHFATVVGSALLALGVAKEAAATFLYDVTFGSGTTRIVFTEESILTTSSVVTDFLFSTTPTGNVTSLALEPAAPGGSGCLIFAAPCILFDTDVSIPFSQPMPTYASVGTFTLAVR